jgi:hypothetical protein
MKALSDERDRRNGKGISKRLVAVLLVVGATVLGATVLREPIAYAAQAVDSTIVGPLDGQGNVKVHEQGTANVSITNSTVPVQRGGEAVTIHLCLPNCGEFFTIPSGKQLVIEYVNGRLFEGGAGMIREFDLLTLGANTPPFRFVGQTVANAGWSVVSERVVITFAGGQVQLRYPIDFQQGGIDVLLSGYLIPDR